MAAFNKNIPVIYYHSAAPKNNPAWFRNYLTLELKYFEEHLKYFKKNGYEHIFLKDLVNGRRDSDIHLGDRSDPDFHRNDKGKRGGKAVCLTFDDGYLDNFIYVYPLLKKYKAKATIFINPVFVDKRPVVRKTLEDYWNNKTSMEEINRWGFLGWDEMRFMEHSGCVDIQSHTLTHTKYFVSDKLKSFHHPGADCLYYIGNQFPERLPYYIEDNNFEKLLPYGFPIFEDKSSIIARQVTIKPSFSHSVIHLLKDYKWSNSYDFDVLMQKIKPLYDEAKKNNSIIESIESEDEYKKRVYFELKESKDIIEKELNKKVEICCWPHGDNNEFAHKTALEIGYKATTLGKANKSNLIETRFDRFGLGSVKNNLFLSNLKARYKIQSYRRRSPYFQINKIYEFFRDNF